MQQAPLDLDWFGPPKVILQCPKTFLIVKTIAVEQPFSGKKARDAAKQQGQLLIAVIHLLLKSAEWDVEEVMLACTVQKTEGKF